jgi:hypothetical protein
MHHAARQLSSLAGPPGHRIFARDGPAVHSHLASRGVVCVHVCWGGGMSRQMRKHTHLQPVPEYGSIPARE